MVGSQIDRVTQTIGRWEFLWEFRWEESGELRQCFIFYMVGELCGVRVVGVDMSIELFERTENTDKELGMRRSRMAHKFNSGDKLRWRSSRCTKEVHGWGNGGFSDRRWGWCFRRGQKEAGQREVYWVGDRRGHVGEP